MKLKDNRWSALISGISIGSGIGCLAVAFIILKTIDSIEAVKHHNEFAPDDNWFK